MNDPQTRSGLWPWMLGAFVFVVGVMVVTWLVGDQQGNEIRGTFGDMFGVANALFSGLAFAGLIFTILLQSQELKLQREELQLTRQEMKDTREEISGQRTALEAQNTVLNEQRFEQSINTVLKTLAENLNSASYILNTTNINSDGKHARASVKLTGISAFDAINGACLSGGSTLIGEYSFEAYIGDFWDRGIKYLTPEAARYTNLTKVLLELLDAYSGNRRLFYRNYVMAHFSQRERDFLALAWIGRQFPRELASRHGLFHYYTPQNKDIREAMNLSLQEAQYENHYKEYF